MIKDGDINWTERESSLKLDVRSSRKHKTKENAPGQTLLVKQKILKLVRGPWLQSFQLERLKSIIIILKNREHYGVVRS